jgi:mRNA interferase HigB
VNVIAPSHVRAFIEVHPESDKPIREWYNRLRKLEPMHFAALKMGFPSADYAFTQNGTGIVIFDIGGNKYRAVCRIDFEYRIAFILFLFTHPEYDEWNKRGRPE